MIRFGNRRGADRKRLLANFRALEAAARRDWKPTEIELVNRSSKCWRSLGASVIGSGHRLNNGVRQDALAVELAGEFIVAVIGDGLSSGSLSQVASNFAARHVTLALIREVKRSKIASWDDIVECATSSCRGLAELFDVVSDGSFESECYYTTILGVVANQEGGVFFNFGDGAAISFKHANSQNFDDYCLSPPEHGDFSGQVYPLLPDDFAKHFRVARFGPSDRIMLMTDGIADFALDETETRPKREFMATFDEAMQGDSNVETTRGLAEYLSSERMNSATQDDKTVIWIQGLSGDDL